MSPRNGVKINKTVFQELLVLVKNTSFVKLAQ